jgi:hypothetical protein
VPHNPLMSKSLIQLKKIIVEVSMHHNICPSLFHVWLLCRCPE